MVNNTHTVFFLSLYGRVSPLKDQRGYPVFSFLQGINHRKWGKGWKLPPRPDTSGGHGNRRWRGNEMCGGKIKEKKERESEGEASKMGTERKMEEREKEIRAGSEGTHRNT